MSELPHRTPQARLDRNLSWFGQIQPAPRPCTDLDLMARLLAALRNLDHTDHPEEGST